MAHSKEDRLSNAFVPKDEDSPIFKKREGVNWSKHPKILKAIRGVKEIQQELHIDSKTRRVFGNLTASSSDLKEDRSQFIPTLIGFLFLSVFCSLGIGFFVSQNPDYGHGYWMAVFTLLLFFGIPGSLLGASWRGHIDLYPRALWRYWREVKDEKRESINSIEAVEHLITCFNKESVSELAESFGHMYHFNKYRDEALAY